MPEDELQLDLQLPQREEREYLLAGLARVVAEIGEDMFLSSPLIVPDLVHFPERNKDRAEHAALLLRRLLSFAGLDELGIELIVYQGERNFLDQHGRGIGQANALAFYQGAKDGDENTLVFGVEEAELGDADALAGSLAHEVAHAVRDDLSLEVADTETEERLTDVTTICLGFGVPLLNSSFQFLTGHHDQHGQQLLWERKSRGYLSPGQLAWLLAAQLVARGRRPREIESVAAALDDGHRSRVREALALFESPEELRHVLGLSENPPQPAELHVGVLPNVPCRIVRLGEELREAPPEGIVFRVRHNWALGAGIVGAVLSTSLAFQNGWGALGWLVGPVVYFPARGLGSLRRTYRCATCSDFLEADSEICSTCHAKVVGEVSHREHRLEAEEKYWAERRTTAEDETIKARLGRAAGTVATR